LLGLGLALFLLVGAVAAFRAPTRPEATEELGTLARLQDTYDPVRAGEPLPGGFRQLLARDAILPIYDPEFVSAADSGWGDGTLVLGVEVDGEARAYPVAYLNRREMVLDEIGGTPLLVSW
jgi:hypothetical protein